MTGSATITINPLPSAAVPVGPSCVYPGENGVVYSVALTNASTYSWSYTSGIGPSGTGGTSSSISANFASNVTSGNLNVYGINSCGAGTSSTLPITVNAGFSAGPDQYLCAATSATMAATNAGTWSCISSSGQVGYVITTPGSPTSTITGLVAGQSYTYVFRWIGCGTMYDDVVIVVQ